MSSRTNRVIDSVIDKKLNKSFVVKSSRNQLLKFANYCTVKKYNTTRHACFITDLMGTNSFISQKDDYNNEICNFFNFKVAKTQSKFNILRLFKPGEILNTVISG